MKYLCMLFLLYAVWAQEEENKDLPIPPLSIGSVRDSNSQTQKCIATFVTSDTLVTTAKCLKCDKECSFTVSVFKNGEEDFIKYTIKSTMVHEDYGVDPQRNNIGLIYLDHSVPDAALVGLYNHEVEIDKLSMYSFTQNLTDDKVSFGPEEVKVLTRSKCTFTLNEYISQSQICAVFNETQELKEEDQGTPLTFSMGQKMYLYGMYSLDKVGNEPGENITVYRVVPPHINWIEINANIKMPDKDCD